LGDALFNLVNMAVEEVPLCLTSNIPRILPRALACFALQQATTEGSASCIDHAGSIRLRAHVPSTDKLFKGRHFDQEIIVLRVRDICGATSACDISSR
jgi:hypothetical protein